MILGVFLVIGVTGFVAEMFRIAAERHARASRSGASSATRSPRWSTAGADHARHAGTRSLWIVHVVAFFAFLAILPITMLRHMFTSPLNMYLRDRDRPKGAMKPMPNLTETDARDVRRLGRRGLHVEAAARHRRLHDVRPLHERSARPTPPASRSTPRDRAQDRRGDGGHRRPDGRRPPIGVDREITDLAPTRCSSGSPPRRSGRARRARRATRSARSTSRSSTRSSTCAATCR